MKWFKVGDGDTKILPPTDADVLVLWPCGTYAVEYYDRKECWWSDGRSDVIPVSSEDPEYWCYIEPPL